MMVSVILLTWNSKKYAVDCLKAIYSGTHSYDFEIIIVDNGSKDSTTEIIEKNSNFPSLKIIKNTFNRGVARARNQGIAEAKGKYILLLDIDTAISEGSIEGLIAFMENNSTVGICAPKLLFPDGSVQNSCRRFPLIHTKIMRRLRGKWADDTVREEYYIQEMLQREPFDVDYVIGACQLIRRAALDEVGRLDANIFYGPEDVDLCVRMQLGKWRVVFIPTLTVVHYEQRVTKCKVLSVLTIKHVVALFYYFNKYRYWVSRKKLYKRIAGAV